MQKILENFARLLGERLACGRRTKEDEARYTFYLALLNSGVYQHTDISLETPHDQLGGRHEIDTVVEPRGGYPALACEFKFDQVPPNGAQNKTNRAGSVFNDLSRLAWTRFSRPTKSLFVYVTDRSMDFYFRNPKHGLEAFYCHETNEPFRVSKKFLTTRPASFTSHLKTDHIEFSTRLFFSADLLQGYHLRVFEVAR